MPRRFALRILSLAIVVALGATSAMALSDGGSFTIVMVTFRGCEDACEGFIDYVEDSTMDAEVVVLDVDRDQDLIPSMRDQVRDLEPDLLVTWGTSVTLGMVGTIGATDPDLISDIPTVFMIVADPVGAEIVESYEGSGRSYIAGTRNRVPEEIQLRVLSEYRAYDRIGVLYNEDEVNSVLTAERTMEIGVEQGFETIERVIGADADGNPRVDDIATAVKDLADAGVDFIYVGSSSFLLANADELTGAALDAGVPLATAYEAMVRDSDGLIALASPYYNVGQLAGRQAERILVEGAAPEDLEIVGLDRYTVLINIDTAADLRLYPPMLMLRYAEIIGGPE